MASSFVTKKNLIDIQRYYPAVLFMTAQVALACSSSTLLLFALLDASSVGKFVRGKMEKKDGQRKEIEPRRREHCAPATNTSTTFCSSECKEQMHDILVALNVLTTSNIPRVITRRSMRLR
mmetsp:Transcript_23461/g.35568  ORF Transcript_23461/g.35568 Transcript_23461/m.35568 type:complete len:121 (+) Transcript_23461:536-898(+)